MWKPGPSSCTSTEFPHQQNDTYIKCNLQARTTYAYLRNIKTSMRPGFLTESFLYAYPELVNSLLLIE